MSISFRKDIGSLKTATVRGTGFDPFEVTYQEPGSADLLNADVIAARENSGAAALWLSARCLRSWALQPALPDNQAERAKLLEAIDPSEVLLTLYLTLRESGREQLKN